MRALLVPAILSIVASAPAIAAAPSAATLLGATRLAESGHASDGSERARGGPPRFLGPLGARGTTHKGWQYVIYYTGKDRSKPLDQTWSDVVIARRKVGDATWQRARVPGFRLTSEDAHNRPNIAISKGDGRVHVVFDHHAVPYLNYAVTAPGVADDPAAVAWNDATFTYRKNFGWKDFSWTITYPDFVDDGTGGLLMYFRDGGTANGEMQKVRYDAATHAWETRITRLSTKDGSWNGQTMTRGPYMTGGIQVSPNGTLQMGWLFREAECFSRLTRVQAGSGIVCNHGLYYAKSRDNGRTWLRTDGTFIADTSKGGTVGIDNVGPPVVDLPYAVIPTNTSNTGAIDPKTGDFHALISHLETPGDEDSRAVFHYVGTSAGKWTGRKSSVGAGSEFVFAGDKAYAFSSRGGITLFVADRSAGFDNWRKVELPRFTGEGVPTTGPFGGGYATWDTSMIDQGRVTLFWQLPTGDGKNGVPSAIWAADYRLP